MKKLFIGLFMSFCLMLVVQKASAQIGSTCANAYVINTLPFSDTSLTTATSGNNYTSLPCSGTLPNFMSGNDYVFEYTPVYNHDISITLANTDLGAAIFVTDTCPDLATSCVAFNTSSPLGNPVIPSVSLTAGKTYYITVSSLSLVSASIVFDITVEELFSYDAAINYIISPTSNCGLSNNEQVKANIINLGTDDIYNFQVMFILDGNASTAETITDTILSGDSLNYTFTQTVNVSNPGVYDLDVIVMVSGEQNPTNDTLSSTFSHQLFIDQLPYVQDFETGDGGWLPGGSGSTWELGTPDGLIIDTSAAGGHNSWVTNLTGNHNLQEHSFVLGPCFDFSNYQNVSMKIDIWYETFPKFDGARIEASINGGASWFIVGGNGEPTNWYNGFTTDTVWTGSSGGWISAQHPLNFLGGQSNVRLKMVYKTGMISFQTAEGFAFDNIMIYECNNMPTADFTFSVSGNTVTVTNASQNATGYLWEYGDQLTLLADTNTNSSYTYMTPGTYSVTLAAFNECGVSYSSQLVTTTVTNIQTPDNYNINIYPIPAKNVLNIEWEDNTPIDKIQFFDMLGQEVFNLSNPDNNIKINTSQWAKGIYYLNIFSPEGISNKKIIIE